LESQLVGKERLIRMVGWNPVTFAYDRISNEEMFVYVQAYYNFESEVVPRVRGVYIVPVSTK